MITAIPQLQIAIDGPAGSGKGSVATEVAKALALPVLDTGLLYRFVAWLVRENNCPSDDESAIQTLIEQQLPAMDWRSGGVFFNGKDCTSRLRGEDVGAVASKVSALPIVRQQLLAVQQMLASHGCVMDGRDIGTVVLPQAQAKFFLTASLRERGRRRWLQLSDQAKHQQSLDDVIADIQARDQRDSERSHAPLIQADDAIVIDSTTMRIDEVVERILHVLQRRGLTH